MEVRPLKTEPCFDGISNKQKCDHCEEPHGGHGGVECWYVSEYTRDDIVYQFLDTHHLHLCQLCSHFHDHTDDLLSRDMLAVIVTGHLVIPLDSFAGAFTFGSSSSKMYLAMFSAEAFILDSTK